MAEDVSTRSLFRHGLWFAGWVRGGKGKLFISELRGTDNRWRLSHPLRVNQMSKEQTTGALHLLFVLYSSVFYLWV